MTQPSIQQIATTLQQQLDQLRGKLNEVIQTTDFGSLRFNQQQGALDQYRMNIYNIELRFDLLLKMLEEKGMLAKDEFNKRWPLYLKNEIGVMGQDGKMDGVLKITFYGN
jgi:hypothetical protein